MILGTSNLPLIGFRVYSSRLRAYILSLEKLVPKQESNKPVDQT